MTNQDEMQFDSIVCDHPAHPDRYKDTGYYKEENKFFRIHLPDGEPEEVTQSDFEFWTA